MNIKFKALAAALAAVTALSCASVTAFADRLKTVILLHGLKQNADSWVRMSRVVRFAAMTGFCVIIPEVQRSWYVNMAHHRIHALRL